MPSCFPVAAVLLQGPASPQRRLTMLLLLLLLRVASSALCWHHTCSMAASTSPCSTVRSWAG